MMWNWRKNRDRDLEREIRSHLELEAEEQASSGLPPDHARYAAQRAFGNTARIHEEVREMWGWIWLERAWQDFTYALRAMRRSPAFTSVAVLSLALGIGANTAIFTFVNAAILKPLPYPAAGRIVALEQYPLQGGAATLVHPRSFVRWHDMSRSFEAIAISQTIPVNTQGADGAEQVSGLWSTAGLFRVFGVEPLLGRVFTEAEALPRSAVRGGMADSRAVVVLDYGFWQRRFGGEAAVLGKSLPLDRGSGTVIGVMPAHFRVGTRPVDLYLPAPLDRARPEAIGSRSFECFALLRPGVSLDAARSEMRVVASQVGRLDTVEKDWGVSISTLRDYLVRDNRRILLVLLAVVGFVLLIACANLAGLLLTRGMGRRSELALRCSLGAGRMRLLQQLLIESLTLSSIGGILGMLVGRIASAALVSLAKDAVSFGQIDDVRFDARVLAFTAGLSLLTALVFGLAPACQASSLRLESALKIRARGSETRGQLRFRAALVTGEVALAVILLSGAGLLLRTFSHLMDVQLGFHPENVLTMRMLVTGDPAHRAAVIGNILERVQSVPGVRSAGAIQFLPLSGMRNDWVFRFVGEPEQTGTDRPHADGATVSHGYLAAMGIPVLRGRDFTRQDNLASPPVVLVNQAFVQQFSPNSDPLGRHVIGDWAAARPAEIVGVIGDIRHNGLTVAPRPTIFLAQGQSPGYITFLTVRTGPESQGLASLIRQEIRRVEPNQPVTAVRQMEDYVQGALARPKLYAVLFATFASLALLLAAIGLYGLLAYSVSRRTHEIGIRMAMGAQPQAVLRAILSQGARMVIAGLLLGTACAAAAGRFVSHLLFGIGAIDVATYAGVASVLCGAAWIAMYLPARRASRVDPVVALRYE